MTTETGNAVNDSVRRASGPGRLSQVFMIGILALLTLILIFAGFSYYRHSALNIQAEKVNELKAIAALKIQQIVSWRSERVTDAYMNSSGLVRSRILRFLKNPADEELRESLISYWRMLCSSGGYRSIYLVSTRCVPLLVAETGSTSMIPSPDARKIVSLAVASQTVIFGDFVQCEFYEHVHLDIAAPVQGEDGQIAAVILLNIIPDKLLFPLVQSWPTPSRTAETLLVRREGDEVVFLNELRHQAAQPLTVRHSVSASDDLPAAAAVRGKTGVFAGRDYRGVNVVADLSPIPDSPWFMVAKVDRDEIFAEARSRGKLILLLVCLSLIVSFTGVAFWYNQSQVSLIEEKFRAEQQLSLSRAIMTAVNDTVFVVDPETAKFRDVNEVCCSRMGFSHEEMVKMGVADIDPIFDMKEWPGIIARARQSDSLTVESIHQRKDGTRFPVEISCRYYCAEKGQDYLIASARDISQRKQAQSELTKYQHRLEELVAERTAELEAVNRELEAFSYSVSHDLKAPLRSIDGFARYLEEDYGKVIDDEGRRLIGIIRGSAKEMGQLITDLLAFSRMSRKELEMTTIDMNSLANDVWKQTEGLRDGRKISFEVGNLPAIRGDKTAIREVLLNLLANSIKFTRLSVKPQIELSACENDGQIEFMVKDNGVGFDMAYKDKLFCVFQRLHTSEEFEGTGIGLAIVNRVIQRHGGKVRAEGKVGGGAVFYFTLHADADFERAK